MKTVFWFTLIYVWVTIGALSDMLGSWWDGEDYGPDSVSYVAWAAGPFNAIVLMIEIFVRGLGRTK